jgi:hypothetical protein
MADVMAFKEEVAQILDRKLKVGRSGLRRRFACRATALSPHLCLDFSMG